MTRTPHCGIPHASDRPDGARPSGDPEDQFPAAARTRSVANEPTAAPPAVSQPHTPSVVLIRRLVRTYLRPHLVRFGIALALMALAAASTAGLAKLLEPVLDEIFIARNEALLWPVAGAVLGVFVVRGLATYGHGVLVNWIGQRIVCTVQEQLFAHLLRSDVAFFNQTSSGHLIARLTHDAGVMRRSVAECTTAAVKGSLTLIGLTIVMFLQDWMLALATFLAFPLGGLFVAAWGGGCARCRAARSTSTVSSPPASTRPSRPSARSRRTAWRRSRRDAYARSSRSSSP